MGVGRVYTNTMTQTFKIEQEVRLTDQDIFDMPVGQATSYWCQAFVRNSGGKVGYDILVRDDYGNTSDDDNDAFHVSTDDIRRTFGKLVTGIDYNGNPYRVSDYILKYFRDSVSYGEDGGVDLGYIDTEAADVLIQIAIWDDVIYG